MRIALATLGCKLNQCESEALAENFIHAGHKICSFKDTGADLYLLNTCTVTSKSEQKARRIIRNAAHTGKPVLVTGCYAQCSQTEIENLGHNVIVIPQSKKPQLLDFSQKLMLEQVPHGVQDLRTWYASLIQDSENDGLFRFQSINPVFHTRAFVKIQDGCDNTCSYCRVPLARGPSQSADPDSLISQIQKLEQNGFLEIVLTGVNITAYCFKDSTFTDLLSNILGSTQKVRIRLSSLEPDKIDAPLLQVLQNPRLCPHFHLPVQSGSDFILRKMHRKYYTSLITEIVSQLRLAKTDPFLAADIIVGFPGETDTDFEATCRLIRDCRFSKVHVFSFSARPGTPAFTFPNKVQELTVKKRMQALSKISDRQYLDYLQSWVGKTVSVIAEKNSKQSAILSGVSENYLTTKTESPKHDWIPKSSYNVTIDKIDNLECFGRMVY